MLFSTLIILHDSAAFVKDFFEKIVFKKYSGSSPES
jgi:hypothetical protein